MLVLVALAVVVVATACGGGTDSQSAQQGTTAAAPIEGGGGLSGDVEVDGSSTVGPFVQAAAEQFQGANPDVKIAVGVSGTGGGFERFCAGETDISNASRQIEDDEIAACKQAGIDYVELQVATDALTVVVNPENDWATCLTVEQLKAMWDPAAEGSVMNWNQVDPSFADEELVLGGPGTDSGTFDYFTKAVNGEEGASRADYTASEDDNVVVELVASDRGALGYFGFSYYEQNLDRLKALEIDGGSGCVAPSPEAAQDGTYAPLSRPLFVYVKSESLTRPEVAAFARYLLDDNEAIAEAALFIPLNADQLATSEATLQAAAG